MGELPNSPDWTCTSKLYSFHGIQENRKTEPNNTLQNLRVSRRFFRVFGVFQGLSGVGMGEISKIFMSWTALSVLPPAKGGNTLFLGTLVGQVFWGFFNWHTRYLGSKPSQRGWNPKRRYPVYWLLGFSLLREEGSACIERSEN